MSASWPVRCCTPLWNPSWLRRFLDMGIEGFLVASSLLGVVAQRLVRRTCRHCKVPYQPSGDELAFFERATGRIKHSYFHGAGCNFCSHTGFEDRIGVFELLRVSEEMRELMVSNATHQTLREQAIRDGMRPMRQEALRLVDEDVTTIAEILRGVYLV